MNAQIKENDDLEDMTEHEITEEEVPLKESTLKKTLKSILITVLSILCITGGVLIHKIHSLSAERTQYRALPVIKNQLSVTSDTVKSSISKTKTVKPDLTVPSTLSTVAEQTGAKEKAIPPVLTVAEAITTPDQVEMVPTEIPIFTSPVVPEMNSSLNPVASQGSETVTASNSLTNAVENEEKDIVENPLPKAVHYPKLEGFTLRDALLFKEHFLTEESCFDDYQKLLHANGKNQEALDVLNDLSPYCLTNQQPVKNVRSAFLKDKKKALIVSYREKKPAWIAYLKAIPASIIEIRKINPVTDKPKDILYKAQNEINRQNVSKAVDLVTQLPLSMQLVMKNFYREAAIYNRAKNSIDMLILSFEYKGE